MFGTTFEESRIVKSPASEDAKEHLTRSIVIASIACGVLFVGMAVFSRKPAVAVEAAAGSFYLAWASYWGILAVANGLAEITIRDLPNLKALSEAIADKLFAKGGGCLLILLPIAVGIVFGTLGGGIYIFLKYREIARNPDASLSDAG